MPTAELSESFRRLQQAPIARAATDRALGYFREMFADPQGQGVVMVLRALAGLADPDEIRQAAVVLAQDSLGAAEGA